MEVQGGNDGGVAAGGLCRLQPLPHLHLLQQLLLAVARQFDHPRLAQVRHNHRHLTNHRDSTNRQNRRTVLRWDISK